MLRLMIRTLYWLSIQISAMSTMVKMPAGSKVPDQQGNDNKWQTPNTNVTKSNKIQYLPTNTSQYLAK